MWTVDGSETSGSGTIVRTALGLAALFGEELEIHNIRSRRDPVGLRPQHQAVAEAVAQLTGGALEGASVGSTALRYSPGHRPVGGKLSWAIGTAGSAMMLAVALLPLAAAARIPSRFRLEGGLFQDFAPSAFHVQQSLLNQVARMGLSAQIEILRPGYFPKGQGVVEIDVRPVPKRLFPFRAPFSGGDVRVSGVALSSHLRKQLVSERMAESCEDRLRRAGYEVSFRIIHDNTAPQPGAALAAFAADSEGNIWGADCAGARGRRSELIGDRVARSLIEDLASGATVDRYVADQLILFAALASGESEFVIPGVTEHVEANLWLVSEFLGVAYQLDGHRLKIQGIGYEFDAQEAGGAQDRQ
ncbi:MAG: RNA 3'-phosphate cyclase [Acidobacteriota bacterium]|nr:MAG: RNA 3'-phosphate cyclase [Acidobacteriota bacterium]